MTNVNINLTITQIEEQVQKTHTRQLDISFNELADMYQNNELNIKPDFQRLFRWSEEKQSRFIESLILEMPVPPIFVIEVEDGCYELIDGLQRISSYLNFRGMLKKITKDESENESEDEKPLKLVGCDIAPLLNGFTYDDLPTAYQIRLKRNFIRMQVIRKESDKLLRYHMFKRLNTGGEMLEPQEIRNCNIRLLGDEFADFLKQIAENPCFKNTINNISETRSKSAYPQELALRFFANKNYREHYIKDIDSFLNSYMEAVTLDSKYEQHVDFDYNEESRIFDKVFRILDKALGSKAFGPKNKNSSYIAENFRIYHYEAIPIALLTILEKVDPDNTDHIELIRNKLQEIKSDQKFIEITTGGGKNTKNQLNGRIEFVKNKFLEIEGFNES